jgi:protein-disulfide isomerase
MPSDRWKSLLDMSASVVTIVASISVAAIIGIPALLGERRPSAGARSERPVPPLPSIPISLNGAPFIGQPEASVVILEYSDFQCAFCVKFASETLPRLIENYVDTGRVRLVYRYLPLESRNPHAMKAAEAAECGHQQGRFRDMHDALFERPDQLDPPNLIARAKDIQLDEAAFRECMDGQVTSRIRRDMTEARELSIAGTPTFLFGRVDSEQRLKVDRRVVGAVTYDRIASILDELLTQSGSR